MDFEPTIRRKLWVFGPKINEENKGVGFENSNVILRN
jgi:hypothetical protein